MSHANLQLLEHAASIQPTTATTSAPSLDPLVTGNFVVKLGPLMRAPREIRDKIYRFLLLTKHTKVHLRDPVMEMYECYQPHMDTLRCHHTYQFHTSILSTNRQVYNEASEIFYLENLFVRVNSAEGSIYDPEEFTGYIRDRTFGFRLPACGYSLPVLSEGPEALACTRHVMEIDLVPAFQPHRKVNHFIFACDDLPTFCRALLSRKALLRTPRGKLLTTELWIIIGDEVGTAEERYLNSNTSIGGHKGEVLTAAIKNAAANLEFATENPRITVERNTSVCGDIHDNGSTMVNGIQETKFKLSKQPIYIASPRLRRLLEPLRVLHSVRCLYIDAPISEGYQKELQASLFRDQPSIYHVFSVTSLAFDTVTAIHDADDRSSAIQNCKGTLDMMTDFWEQSRNHDLTRTVMTGQYAGLTYQEAMAKMQYNLYLFLARTNLAFRSDLQHVRTAHFLVKHIVEKRIDKLEWYSDASPSGAHDHATAHYLDAQILEALDQLEEYDQPYRSICLRSVVNSLKQALRYEPHNAWLKKELLKKQKEKKAAVRFETFLQTVEERMKSLE